MVLRATGSRAGAMLCAALLALNPNILYLQSTPMTEPLLLGLLAWALWLVTRAMELDTPRARLAASVVLAMAVMTRYEAWPFAVAVLAAVPVASWHAGRGWRRGLTAAGAIAMWPVAACLWFFVHSKVTVGSWFVTGGFYVPDPAYQFQPLTVTGAVWWGLRQLGSEALAYALVASVALIGTWWWRHRMPSTAVLALAWLAVGALPWYAFFQGHPFRIRYMVPLVVGSAVVVSLAVGRLPRGRALVAAALLAGIWWTSRPFDRGAAMVLEAQWDRPRSLERRAVTGCLPAPGGDETVMASMGSLAHYMHELSASGFALRDFLHEGNGDLWLQALERPGDYVRWVLVEERAEGGDMLALRAAGDPAFLAGFTRICEGGGVALYGLQ
jgi:hypothetical protein